VSHKVVIQLFGVATTRAGLTVNAKLDNTRYSTNAKVSDEEIASVSLKPSAFHREWTYPSSRVGDGCRLVDDSVLTRLVFPVFLAAPSRLTV